MLSVAVALLLAAPQSQVDKDLFKFYYLRAERFYREGDFRGAVASFREAEGLKPTAEVAFNLAQCHEALTDLALASFYYRLYLERAPGAEDAAEVMRKVDGYLSAELKAGRVLLEVRGPPGSEVRLSGRTVTELPFAAFLPRGPHTVQAQRAEGVVAKAVTLESAPVSVSLEDAPPGDGPPDAPDAPQVASRPSTATTAALVPLETSLRDDEPAAVATTTGTTPPGGSAPGGSSRRALHVTSMAVLGTSAAALAAGTVLGLMSNADRARATGPERVQLTAREVGEAAVSANRNGAAANVAWVAGGLGALGGGLLFAFTLPQPGEERGR